MHLQAGRGRRHEASVVRPADGDNRLPRVATRGRDRRDGRSATRAGPVEDRTTSLVGSTTGSVARLRAPRAMAMTLCTAVSPSARSGAATVVRLGVTSSAAKMSSKPTMLRSSGTLTPDATAPRSTPMASRSLYATTAVQSPRAVTSSAAAAPAATVGAQGPIRRARRPNSAQARRTASQRAPSVP